MFSWRPERSECLISKAIIFSDIDFLPYIKNVKSLENNNKHQIKQQQEH